MKNEKQSWNPVLNKFLEIKQTFINTFGKEMLWKYPDADSPTEETCLEYWVRLLNIPEYTALLEPLQLDEKDNLLLIRYANFWSAIEVEDEKDEKVTAANFWDIYDGFYRECRSVVLDTVKECLVITPFKKFRNLNEAEECSLDVVQDRIKHASCIEISEKLDGSMQSARYYEESYLLTGSQRVDVNKSWRLQDGYDLLESLPGYYEMLKDNPEDTHIFESITMKDAHVVKYTKDQEGLYLIGIRNVNTGEEASYAEVLARAKKYNIPSTKVFTKTLDEVLSELDDKQSNEAEGFVLNIDGFKVKIKYNDYCQMHRILDKISSINLVIKQIADGTFDDFISKVPMAYRDRIYPVAEAVWNYERDMKTYVLAYYKQAPKDSRKEFMIWVDAYVPIKYRGYTKEYYLKGVMPNFIRTGDGVKIPYGYKKLSDMGIDVKEIFKKEVSPDDREEDTRTHSHGRFIR